MDCGGVGGGVVVETFGVTSKQRSCHLYTTNRPRSTEEELLLFGSHMTPTQYGKLSLVCHVTPAARSSAVVMGLTWAWSAVC